MYHFSRFTRIILHLKFLTYNHYFFQNFHLLEHRLNSNDCITISQGIFLSRIAKFFVYDHHILRESDTSAKKIVQTVDSSLHPVYQRKIGYSIEECNFRYSFQQKNDWIQRCFWSEWKPHSLTSCSKW